MTPKEVRRAGSQIALKFAVGTCWLGAVLVAATDKGVAAVLLGDNPDELINDLQTRFSNAQLIVGDSAFEDTMSKVVGLIDQPGSKFNVPLDIQGTAFQHRVWQALSKIPCGTTMTYSEIANLVGMPEAVRAVAAACAANMIAVAIPCHRVIRADGSLSGYRWGIERKRALLKREQE